MNNQKVDIDSIFAVLENPIRRKILAKLAEEHHYPLQLSKELNISQQAIMKHLKVLEEHNLVESFEEKSTLGGPPRKCYVSNKCISLRIDIGPNMFRTEVYDYREMENDLEKAERVDEEKINKEMIGFSEKYNEIRKIKEPRERLQKLSKLIQNINKELEELKVRRAKLLSLQETVIRESNQLIGELFGEYDERKLMYYIISHETADLAAIAEALDIREKVIMDMLRHLLKQRKFLQLDYDFIEL
ncbi:helix-turn-helix domain-containing protein [[Eubacterium] cellulosolvens]